MLTWKCQNLKKSSWKIKTKKKNKDLKSKKKQAEIIPKRILPNPEIACLHYSIRGVVDKI